MHGFIEGREKNESNIIQNEKKWKIRCDSYMFQGSVEFLGERVQSLVSHSLESPFMMDYRENTEVLPR